MTPVEFEAFLENATRSQLGRHGADVWRDLARSAIALRPTDSPVHSRLGGAPDVGPDFEWPQHAKGPYRFIAQIDFAENDVASDLPADGRLLLFAGDDPQGEDRGLFWHAADYIRGIYVPADGAQAATRRADVPAGVDAGSPTPVAFSATVSLPRNSKLRVQWPEEEFMADLLQTAIGAVDLQDAATLLGYPNHGSLYYDPTPLGDWICLLNLASDAGRAWSWHDGGRLSVFIERTALARGDFGDLRADAG